MPGERVHEMLCGLYRGARGVSSGDFQEWAMDRLRELVPFDSGIWVIGKIAKGLEVHALYSYRQPLEMMENYEDHKAGGGGSPCCLRTTPGRTCDLQEADGATGFRRTAAYHEHARRFDIENVMCTYSSPGATGLQSVISLYRGRAKDEYSERERRLKNFLFAHLIQAATINQLLFVEEGVPGLGAPGRLAVADRTGILLQSGRVFGGLFGEEWPEWDGIRVPEACWACRERPGVYVGRRVVVAFRREGDATIVAARRRDALDELTARQRQIAELLAAGASYKDIGRSLDLSPSTITNQANIIYRKTGTPNKAALASMLVGRSSR